MRKSILIILFSLLGVLNARAYDFEVDGFYYNILSGTSDKVEVTNSGDGASYTGSVFIPSTVTYSGTTYSVTAIGNSAFSFCEGLTSVTIPEGVTSIGASAFYTCSGLTSVTIPESVTTIGWSAFRKCTSISTPLYNSKIFAYMPTSCSGEYAIPSGIQSIADCAFYECMGLTSVTIPEGVTSIGYQAFYGCGSLTSVTIPEGVTSIEYQAFYGCGSLTSVTIPEGVTSIEYQAFYGCGGLTSVTIPNSVTSIRNEAFAYCSGLTSVEWNARHCGDFSYDTRPFAATSLTSITFGNEVEHIPAYLCYRMNKLISVTIPESVDTIGSSAFSGCSGLTSVMIGESVTSIGSSAFSGCIGLRSVTIPESVTTIGSFAFYDCRGLISVTSLSKIPPYCTREGVFSDDVHTDEGIRDTYFQPLYVPRGSKSLYESAYEWHKFSKIQEISGVGTAMVTVHPNDATMGTVTGGGEYKEGEQAMLAAIPYQGYYFARWDDGNTNNPRMLTVSGDTTITAIFAKNGGAPDNPDIPTANENSEADNFRVYVQDRTIYLSENVGTVQVYNVAGQCVYNGISTAIPVRQDGVYIVNVGGRRCKVLVR